jgi:hypothetical protein
MYMYAVKVHTEVFLMFTPTQEDGDEPEEVVLPRWATQLDGSPP